MKNLTPLQQISTEVFGHLLNNFDKLSAKTENYAVPTDTELTRLYQYVEVPFDARSCPSVPVAPVES